MSNFLYDSDDVPVYDPMEAYDLSMRGDCVPTDFSLNPSEVPTNFSLNPSEVPSGQAMATFDLTPASGGGDLIFNLTPVSETGALSLTPVAQTESQSSSELDSLGLGYDRLLQTEMGNVSGVSPMYTQELSNTISAMTFSPPPSTNATTSSSKMNFSPPIQVNSSGNLTPDFTGLLPPPPPSSHERSNSRPPPQLLAMASPVRLDQTPDLPSYPPVFPGSRSIVEAYRPTISTPSPVSSPIPASSPLASPRSQVSPGPPLYSLPKPQQSPNHPHRLLQPHQMQPNPPPLEPKSAPPAGSPKSQLSQLLQQSPKIPVQPSPILPTYPSPKQAPNISTLPSPSYPPSASPTYSTSKQAPKISTHPSPSYPPSSSPSYPPSSSPSYPPASSPTYPSSKQVPKLSTLNSPSYQPLIPQKSPHQFSPSPQLYSTPPPPYKSPPYSNPFYPSEPQSLLSTALQSPSTPGIQSHHPQMSPKSTLHIAPSVTLTKKQRASAPRSPLPVKSPPPFPYSNSPSPQTLPPYPTQFAPPHPNLPLPPQPQPFLKPAPAPTQAPPISAPPPFSAPPPYSATGQPKLPSYSLEELKDLPGVNLKKSTVDLNTYVNTVVQNRHPHFANIDGFAERCLACIVRKIRSNLPTLKALEAISMCGRGSQADPGCVLIPRMKDGRITIARPGGGAGGTKKIHPHLALVQIFKNPSVVNHNTLVSSSYCAAPFIAKGEGEGEMVCISPMHYTVDSQKVKSPSTPKKKLPPMNSLPPTQQLNTANALLNHIRAMEQPKLESSPMDLKHEIGKALDSVDGREHLQEVPPAAELKVSPPRKQTVSAKVKRSVQDIGSDSDFLSDSEDEVDWVKKWEEERVDPGVVVVQEFNEEELVNEIEIMAIKMGDLGKEELVAAEKKLVDRLKIVDGFRDFVSGKYDLEPLKALQKSKPKKTVSKKILKVDKQVPTVRKKPGPKPRKKIGEAWISDPNKGKANTGEKPKPPESKTEVTGASAIIASSTQHVEEEKDEAVIQNLLEDIKGSFESQFEMDLETFGSHEEQSFSNQDFALTNAFNLSSLDELSKDSFVGQPALVSGVTSGSSDAMFGGAGAGLELPGLVASWQDKEEVGHREQDMQFRQEQGVAYRQGQQGGMSFRGQDDISQDMPYTTEHQGMNFREQQELFSSRVPEDLTFDNREPEDLTFGNREPEDLTFGHRQPEDLTFGHREPVNLAFGHTEPEDLTFGHRESQQLASDQTANEFGTSAFLSAGSISQEQFLNMFDQD